MRKELVVKGRSLTGTSDLTLLAPLIPGLVPSLDAITYKTRAKRLLKTLQGGRASLHEYAAYRPISDAVERVAMIHSFRVAVLEPEDKVLLAVTFDGTWESYIRVLWQKVGTLLDIIFCNTQGYVLSTSSFEEWTGWVRRVQVETSFYYNTHGLTVEDVAYLREEERIHRDASLADRDVAAARHSVQSAETIAWNAANQADVAGGLETLRQGLQSLAVLFRLTDTYLPGTPDGEVLRRAAWDLLQEFTPLVYDSQLPAEIAKKMRARFARQIAWLQENRPPARPVPPLPQEDVQFEFLADVQGGILRPYEDVTHGCLVLIALDDRIAAARLLDELIARTTREGYVRRPDVTLNVAFTHEGLRACGLSEDQLEFFPQEFREGMEARASMLGDFRANHPRRWRLPLRNWKVAAVDESARVDMAAVHLVLQLRTRSASTETDPAQPAHPLHKAIEDLVNAPGSDQVRPGIRVLSVQGMKRMHRNGKVVEHFGFVDGGSDPVFNANEAGADYRNRVHLGEFLLGRDNQADAARPPATPQERERDAWLRDGSFLVVRKLSQHVHRLHNLVLDACASTGLGREDILAKMMGRTQDGDPLAAPGVGSNDFHYGDDAQGARCPFHAHIRRANPRPLDPDQVFTGPELPLGGRHPRLVRRSMSYGPPFPLPADLGQPVEPDGEERGLVFMAYNASISEQFEVVQRWISGGNSAGGHSRQADPFLGVPEWNEQRTYRFEQDGKVHRIALDGPPAIRGEPEPIVRLEWGMYLFTPSIPALRKLRNVAAANLPPAPPWSADEGEAIVQQLLRLEGEQGSDAAISAWKAVLEDPDAQEQYRSAAVWAAIRRHHAGVLRTAYGVLVADRALVMQVLDDSQGHYSVAGYRERMLRSIGEIYLGLDAGVDGEYERQSQAANKAISAITEQEAFDLALRFTTEALDEFIQRERDVAVLLNIARWELNLDAKEVVDKVLARLCQEWFGLPADPHGDILVPGSWRWDWRDGDAPIYPAHFTAPSRYIFQPNPGTDVKEYGERIGAALTAAITRFLTPYRAAGTVPQTPQGGEARLAKAILAAFPEPRFDDLTARIFTGVLMGFLPTVDGNVRLSLNEWLRDGTFWSLRAAWSAGKGVAPVERARALLLRPLVRAMQLRPSPELVWRRATRGGIRIGEVELRAGDTVVAAVVAATQQSLAAGSADVSPIFGGARRPPPPPHPTHACPGYRAGMGVLLGMLSGFMEVAQTMRPSPAPLAFTFEGPVPSTPTKEHMTTTSSTAESGADADQATIEQGQAWARFLTEEKHELEAMRAAPNGRRLLALGDSWFNYWPSYDALRMLQRKYGYAIDSVAVAGTRLAEIAPPDTWDPTNPGELPPAGQGKQLYDLHQVARRLSPADRKATRAVLLSGGGNDVAAERAVLKSLLNPAGSGQEAINEKAIEKVVDIELRRVLAAVLSATTEICRMHFGRVVPIVLHGYGYPVPDGRGTGVLGPWLQPVMVHLGYTNLADGRDIMRKLIDRLNRMQLKLLADNPSAFGHVLHADVRPDLSNDLTGNAYKKSWQNELHPAIGAGFIAVADRLESVLKTLP